MNPPNLFDNNKRNISSHIIKSINYFLHSFKKMIKMNKLVTSLIPNIHFSTTLEANF